MATFNWVTLELPCTKCGNKLTDFQTKDGVLEKYPNTLQYWEVNHFYDICHKCHTWNEYEYNPEPRPPRAIEDYKMVDEDEVWQRK